MKLRQIGALVVVELKKLYRDPMSLMVLMLMPVGLTLIMHFALSGITNDYYPYPGMNHFEYLLPGLMGYAVIYMGMMVALAIVEYRQTGLLQRVETTPVSTSVYLGSHIVSSIVIAAVQGLIVLLVAWLLGFQPQGGVVGILVSALFLALLAVSAVGLGLMTAAVSKDSGTAGGLSVIFILPMMMFGGLLAVFNDPTLAIARFMPNFYLSEPLMIILHSGDLSNSLIWKDLLILTAIGVVLVVAGIQIFKRIGNR